MKVCHIMSGRYYKRKRKKTPQKAKVAFRGVNALSLAVVAVVAVLFGYCAYTYTGTVVPTMELLDGQPTFRFVDVGQGDCTLVTYHGDSVMIDCGPVSSGEIAANYAYTYAPVLDYLIITHPHEDHMGGAAEVLSTVVVKNLVLSDVTVDEKFFTEAIETAELYGTNIIWLSDEYSFEIGDISVEILDSFDFKYSDLNDASLVTKITVGETSLLVTGDAETTEENYLLKNCFDQLDCDILKVGHHGSRSSTGEEFLDAVSPETCVISVGQNNRYGHPTQEVMERIYDYGAEIHRTDLEGHVIIRGEYDEKEGLLAVLRRIFE